MKTPIKLIFSYVFHVFLIFCISVFPVYANSSLEISKSDEDTSYADAVQMLSPHIDIITDGHTEIFPLFYFNGATYNEALFTKSVTPYTIICYGRDGEYYAISGSSSTGIISSNTIPKFEYVTPVDEDTVRQLLQCLSGQADEFVYHYLGKSKLNTGSVQVCKGASSGIELMLSNYDATSYKNIAYIIELLLQIGNVDTVSIPDKLTLPFGVIRTDSNIKYELTLGSTYVDTNRFFEFIVTLSDSKLEQSIYPRLTQLIGAYKNGLEEFSVDIDRVSSNNAVEYAKQHFNSSDDYGKYSISVTMNLLGLNGDTSAKEFYDTQCQSHSVNNLGDGCTQEEKFRLYIWYATVYSSLPNIDTSTEGINIGVINWFNNVENGVNIGLELSMNETATPIEQVRQDGVKVVDKYVDNVISDFRVDYLPNYFKDVSVYLLCQLNGLIPTDEPSTENGTDLSTIPYSLFIDGVIPQVGIVKYDYPIYDYQFPKIGNIKTIPANSSVAQLAYRRLYASLHSLALYGRYEAGIESYTENGQLKYVNTALEEFVNTNINSDENMTDGIKRYIVAYINIHDGLEYLGIEPYTPELKYICGMYQSISGLSTSFDLTAYDPSMFSNEPMNAFFSIDKSRLSYYYNLGVALSATYMPLQTNLYEVGSISYLDDTDFVERFHYPYGFYRKALYIDKNANAAVDRYVSNRVGDLRVATLNDLLECERDIVLYVDSGFYNIDELADKQGYSYDKYQNTEQSGDENTSLADTIGDWWSDLVETSIEATAKTGGYTSYNENIKKNVSSYGSKSENRLYDNRILSSSAIQRYLTGYDTSGTGETVVYNEYTPLIGWAVTSSIYRDKVLYNIANKYSKNKTPVFVSSPNLAGITGVDADNFNSVYNYAMLKNISGNLTLDYKSTLDMTSPLYIDIYGNILTESGLVVIPACSNSTLCDSKFYSIANVGFLSLYGTSYAIPEMYNNSSQYMSELFSVSNGVWLPKSQTVNNVYINFSSPSLSKSEVVECLRDLTQSNINKGLLKFDERVYLITEVLRGAPIENIRKDFEGIQGIVNKNKFGLSLASKIDELAGSLLSSINGNSLVTLPNIAYLDYVEYIVLYAFKLLIAVMIGYIIYKLYVDAINRSLGVKTILSFVGTVVLFVGTIYIVPKAIDVTYYNINKALLQNEVEYVTLLNEEKQNQGREIGLFDVNGVETSTKLYIKVADISVPWYKVLGTILTSDVTDTLDTLYEEAYSNNLMSYIDGVERRTNGLYMNINDILNSTIIEYDVDKGVLTNKVVAEPYASYSLPYYVVLDNLIDRINEYNSRKNIKSFTTRIQSQGAVRTIGVCSDFFTSREFLKTYQDICGFKDLYNIDTGMVQHSTLSPDDIELVKSSVWYVGDRLKYIDEFTPEQTSYMELEDGCNEIDMEARQFVLRNMYLLNKVTDETFIKVMALRISLMHNSIFHVPSCKSIEIFDIDSRDLMRLSMADRSKVLSGASKSFARFVYDTFGTLTMFVVGLLVIVYFISSIVKPVCLCILFAVMVVTIVYNKAIKHRDGVIEGLFISLFTLCGMNLIYDLLLKFTFTLGSAGVNPVVNILVQILVHVLYLLLLVTVTFFVIKDWQNYGLAYYSQFVSNLNIVSNVSNLVGNSTHQHKKSNVTGRSLLLEMERRDEVYERENQRTIERG